jgi:hypothetical protein
MAKYGPKAQALVAREMKAMEAGKLRSGGNGAKVTNPKQAIAIALSEARKEGAKMPPPPKGSASAEKTRGTKKTTAKKAPAKKTAAKKAATKKTATKKAPAKKASAKKAATK